MRVKRLVALTCVAAQVVTMGGCGRRNDVASMDLMPATTKQQVLDYYAKSLKYDAVITRAADKDQHVTKYEEQKVTDSDTISKIESMYKTAENQLGAGTYSDGVVSEDIYNYIKGYLNDMSLSNASYDESNITTALGYYFMDVTYDTKEGQYGTFHNDASLLGMNGAFAEDYLTGVVSKNNNFIQAAVKAGNKYFLENQIAKHVEYDEEHLFQVLDGAPVLGESDNNVQISDDTSEEDMSVDEASEQTENDSEQAEEGSTQAENDSEQTEDASEQTEDDSEQAEDNEDDTDEGQQEDSEEEATSETEANTETNVTAEQSSSDYMNNTSDRQVKFDVNYMNSIVGTVSEYATSMPELSLIYDMPSSQGTIDGVGLYPCGINGMHVFGYDRSKTNGKLTLRYIFKEADDGSGELETVNIYPKELRNTIGEFNTDTNVLIPDYLEQELENVIERADRVIVDCNLGAMISDGLFTDIGYGVLRGYLMDSTDILKCMSVVRQVVARDIENKAYILEVETTITEGAKSCNAQGTFRDKSYVVVQQIGNEFKITDWVRVSRDVTDEPDIDSGNSTLKRLVALNLTGEVSEDTKESAKEVLSDLYTASTYRYTNGPFTVTDESGAETTYTRGMYDCFDNDAELLSSDKKEELNSRLRSYLTAYGANVPCTYTGYVDEWIGGYKNQVEFTTEEIMMYGEGQAAKYFRMYYLMSSINDTWYIDEMKVLDEEDLDAGKIQSEYNRIAKGELPKAETQSDNNEEESVDSTEK
jgi:AAA ATPase containing von willebrand factor type A (VWA) domain-like